MEVIIGLWRPFLEIGIIWFVLYMVFRFFQGTRAVQLLTGLIILALVFYSARLLNLNTINWVFTKLFAFGLVAFVILFQPELRRALTRIGQNTVWGGVLRKGGLIDEVVEACENLSKSKTGALIAIERDVGLKNYIESGVSLDAKVSPELISTIFYPGTALHDGGAIIQGDRIASCGSLFPLTQNPLISKTLGTRHRAALGLTEETDAVCVIVSEETGTISVSVHGKLTRDLDADGLRRVLRSIFKPDEGKGMLSNIWQSFKSTKEKL